MPMLGRVFGMLRRFGCSLQVGGGGNDRCAVAPRMVQQEVGGVFGETAGVVSQPLKNRGPPIKLIVVPMWVPKQTHQQGVLSKRHRNRVDLSGLRPGEQSIFAKHVQDPKLVRRASRGRGSQVQRRLIT